MYILVYVLEKLKILRYKNTNNKIKNFGSKGTDMKGIIHDSDITVLKENYNYYFWSILAVGTVLVTMNVSKN